MSIWLAMVDSLPLDERTLTLVLLAGLAVWLVAAPLAVWGLSLDNPRKIDGPSRLGADESAWILVVVLVGGIFVSAFATNLVMQLIAAPAGMEELVSGAVLFTLAFLVILGGNALFRRRPLRRMGLRGWKIPAGLAYGVIGLALIFPLVLAVSLVTTLIWRALGLAEPEPHPLLERLGVAAEPELIALLVISAVVLAPLTEELIFRGMIQTILTRAFGGDRGDRAPGPRGAFPVVQPGRSLDPFGPPPGAVSPVPPPVPAPAPAHEQDSGSEHYQMHASRGLWSPAAGRWASVIVTSLIFAAMHLHMSLAFGPPLFLLSLAMGYAYERTGNLWVPIMMHALFNTAQSILFVLLVMGE